MVLCEAGSGDLSPQLPFSAGYVPSVAEHVPTDILTVQDMLFKASQSSDPTKDTIWIRWTTRLTIFFCYQLLFLNEVLIFWRVWFAFSQVSFRVQKKIFPSRVVIFFLWISLLLYSIDTAKFAFQDIDQIQQNFIMSALAYQDFIIPSFRVLQSYQYVFHAGVIIYVFSTLFLEVPSQSCYVFQVIMLSWVQAFPRDYQRGSTHIWWNY